MTVEVTGLIRPEALVDQLKNALTHSWPVLFPTTAAAYEQRLPFDQTQQHERFRSRLRHTSENELSLQLCKKLGVDLLQKIRNRAQPAPLPKAAPTSDH